MIVVAPKGLERFIKLVAVELPVERADAKLRKIERHIAFARRYGLVRKDQETELVEMLIHGATFQDAVAELRARLPLS